MPWYVPLRSAWAVLAKLSLERLAKATRVTMKGTSEILSLPFGNENIWQLPGACVFPTLHGLINLSSITSKHCQEHLLRGLVHFNACTATAAYPTELVLRQARVSGEHSGVRLSGEHTSDQAAV